MSTLAFPTKSPTASPINRRRLTLAIFTTKDKDKQYDGNSEDGKNVEKIRRKKTQVPSGGRGGLGNIRANRTCTTSAPAVDPELAKILNPANFIIPDQPSGEYEVNGTNRNSASANSILTTATSSSSTATISTASGSGRPPLSVYTSLSSSSGSSYSCSSKYHASSRPTFASQSLSSFDTTCPPSLISTDFSCEHIATAATSGVSSAQSSVFSDSVPHHCTECSPPPSPVATTPRTSTFSSSLQRVASSLSHASSGTTSSGTPSSHTSGSSSTSGSTVIRASPELMLRLQSGLASADAGTAAAYATHLRLDARARRAIHGAGSNGLARVDEELFSGLDGVDEEYGRKKGKKGKSKKSGEGDADGQFVVRVRTGRGGAGVSYRRDGADAVNPNLYPTTAALTRINAERTAAQEQDIVDASRARAKMVVRTGRGGAGSINIAKAKGMARHAKKLKPAKEIVYAESGSTPGGATVKKRKGLSLWRRVAHRSSPDSEPSPVIPEEHAHHYGEMHVDDGFLVVRPLEEANGDNRNIAGIGAHKISSAIRLVIPSHGSSDTLAATSQPHAARSGENLRTQYNRSIHMYDAAQELSGVYAKSSCADGASVFDGLSVVFPTVDGEDGEEVLEYEYDDEEDEEEDDSDIDPDLSPIATYFDERMHRCARVDAGGGGRSSPSVIRDARPASSKGYEDATYALASLTIASQHGVDRKVSPRSIARCAPTRPSQPPPTTALPPVPVGL